MPVPPITDAAVVLNASAAEWRDAVRVAGRALVDSGATKPSYTDAMVEMIDQNGPYVVIAPGLALAHARIARDILHDGLAVVTLAEPVRFGHAHNDPVRVVLALAVSSVARHLPIVAKLANLFNDPETIPALARADSADEVRRILGQGDAQGRGTDRGQAPAAP